jgi:Ca2+-binding EF-hand superfamily protein
MLRAFEDIRVVFDRVDADKNGAIDESELKLLLAELDTADLDDATIADIFAQADANGDGSIDYREFVALAAVLYLMSDRDPGAPPESETEARRLVHVALDRVLEAWLYFDRDRRGFISRAEVKDGLRVYKGEARDQATGGKKKKAHVGVDSNLLAARFEEINWGRHDVVTFQEFLYAVEGWVGLEDEEE